MTIRELNYLYAEITRLEFGCSDKQIASYLSMAKARIAMLQRRFAKRGTFEPDTHPKRKAKC